MFCSCHSCALLELLVGVLLCRLAHFPPFLSSWVQIVSRSLKWRNRRPFSKLPIQSPTARQPSANVPRTRAQLVAGLPPIYPKDLFADIQRDNAAVDRMLVVLDDDPTGTQSVHSLPVLADWSVQALIREVFYCAYVRLDGRRLGENCTHKQYSCTVQA